MAVARSSSDDSVICYVLPVMWMTSPIGTSEQKCKNQARYVTFRPVRQVMEHQGRSLPSRTASCLAPADSTACDYMSVSLNSSLQISKKRPDNEVTFIQVTSFANAGLVVSFSTEGVNDQWPLR